MSQGESHGGSLRIALITTTVHVPRVLAVYRALRADVHIVVTGDEKTPPEARAFVESLGDAVYLGKEDQARLGYACSSHLGWSTIGRRNIAALEAMKTRPDVLVTIDDDNLPVAPSYFDDVEAHFSRPARGLLVDSPAGFWNAGELLSPAVHHRGFPHDRRRSDHAGRMSGASGAKVGIGVGLWAGDPDIDAVDRITSGPTVRHWSGLLDGGVVLAQGCYAPFNSQNTSFLFELAPLMWVWPGVGRYDDIWASYAAERVLRGTPYHVRFGRPLVWQERNAQSLWKNLRDELLGMEHTSALTSALDELDVGSGPVVERLRQVFLGLEGLPFLPRSTLEAGLAWCDDVQSVMSI